MTTIPAHVAITEAAVGGKVLILLFVWLISGAAGSSLSERKGYGERLGRHWACCCRRWGS